MEQTADMRSDVLSLETSTFLYLPVSALLSSASVVSYVTFILLLFIAHFPLLWYRWKARLLDYGISWASLLILMHT